METTPIIETLDDHLVIAGIDTASGSWPQVLDRLASLLGDKRAHLVVTPNVDHLIRLTRDAAFAEAYAQADLALVDGMPVVALARHLGCADAQRHTGADLLWQVCRRAPREDWTIAIVGGRPDIAERAVSELHSRTGARVHAVELPVLTSAQDPAAAPAVDELHRVAPDFVFCCLGSPKQEQWIVHWRDRLPPAVYVGSGAAVDFAAGDKRRAPRPVQRVGLEWVWRLAAEPSRLWRRYLLDGPRFVGIARQAAAERREGVAERRGGVAERHGGAAEPVVQVIQLGPDPAGSGGMSSVIEEIASMPSGVFAQQPIPTWGDRTGVASLWTAARAGATLIRTRRRWQVAHIHLSEYGSFVREGALVVLSRVLGKRVVVTLHGARFDEHVARHRRLTAAVLGRADVVTCLGDNTRRVVSELSPSVRTEIVYNPLGGEHFAEDAAVQPVSRDAPTVLFGGELGRRKGVDRLVAAWPVVRERFPDAVLVVAGPTPEASDEAAALCVLEGVDHRGNLTRTELGELIKRSDLSVLPSRAEVLPMFVLESLAKNTPVVMTKVGEWQELADSASVRFVDVDGRDEPTICDALAEALIEGLADTDAAAHQETTRWAAAKFSSTVIADRLADVYLAGGRKG